MTMTNEEIVRHYNQARDKKTDITVLAELNGCSNREIREILQTASGQMVTREVKRKFDETVAFQLYEDGLNDREIAAKLGVSKYTIFNWRHENDYPPNVWSGKDQEPSESEVATQPSLEVDLTEELPPFLRKIQKIYTVMQREDDQGAREVYLDLMIKTLVAGVELCAHVVVVR